MILPLLVHLATNLKLSLRECDTLARIGVTMFPDGGVDGEQLLRHADQTMYLAIQPGKNQYHMFDVRHDTQVKALHKKLERIPKALYETNLFYSINLKQTFTLGALLE